MGFMFDGLNAESYDRNYSDRQLVQRIVSYFRPQAAKMFGAAGTIVLAALLDTGIPIFVAGSLDQLQQGITTDRIVAVSAVLALLAGCSWVANAVRQTLSSRAVGNVVLQLREDACDAVLQRDLSFYDTIPSGRVVSRVTSDTQAFSQVMALTLDLLSRLLLVVLIVGYLFTVSVYLTLLLLALAPFIFGAALAFRAIARRTITHTRRMSATVSAHIQETISGIGVAKTFRQEPAIYAEFLRVNQQSRQVNLRTRYVFSSIFPLMNLMAGIGTASLVYFGGLSVYDGALTAGSWYLFIQGLSLFWFPLTSIASFWSQFQLGLAAGERVFALIDAEPKVVQTDDVKLTTVKGELRFEHVRFSYDDRPPTNQNKEQRTKNKESANRPPTTGGEEERGREGEGETSHPPSSILHPPSSGDWVLPDFSLTIRAGETLALVGHTGSGKSSVVKLIARFYEFQGGRITIDGVDIRSLDLDAYRAHLGIVTQTPFLFAGTVLENIRYGRPEASDEEVLRVARQVGAGDWIASLPNGMATEVGERGGNLSMGQRQIVALARVLLQDPAIVILDEATASIDPLTEALIQEGLDVVLEGRTSIVIAHRLSTVRNADRIIVLRQGQIIEEGNHAALLAAGGHYAELYNTYFRHQSLEYIEDSWRALAEV